MHRTVLTALKISVCDERRLVFFAQTAIYGNRCLGMLKKFALQDVEKRKIAIFNKHP